MTRDAYDRLCAWSLGHGDREFVHQHVVDAWMLQTATEETKPIGIAFALAGLYLHLERGFDGREVQRAHMKLGRTGGPWPTFELPAERGAVTPAHVLEAPDGSERVQAVRTWCRSVWLPWSGQRQGVLTFLRTYQIIS